jgi:signal transduction histidine kinase
MIVSQDITEKKNAEVTLNTNFSLLRMAGKTAKFGGWSLNLADMKITWSDEVAAIHEVQPGYEPSLSEGIQFYASEWREQIQKAVSDCIKNGISYDVELEIITTNENRIWVRTTGEAIYDESGKIIRIQGSFQDIDERKLAEKALEKSAARLKELIATKDKFFSIIAHDLKGPFNSIIGLSEILNQQIKNHNYAEVGKYVEIIQNSSQQAFELLVNLLEWSKSQTGLMVFSPVEINIIQAIEESINLLREEATQKNIAITMDTPQKLMAKVDPAMLNTILRNLFSNAIKFTNPGGGMVISAERTTDELVISVTDNGVGISQESIDKLFRIEETHSTLGTLKEKGTGLGLLLCKEFVEKHEGRIWVESEPDKGSTFRFSIPLQKKI